MAGGGCFGFADSGVLWNSVQRQERDPGSLRVGIGVLSKRLGSAIVPAAVDAHLVEKIEPRGVHARLQRGIGRAAQGLLKCEDCKRSGCDPGGSARKPGPPLGTARRGAADRTPESSRPGDLAAGLTEEPPDCPIMLL